jgi:hypothetical protein
MLWMSRHSSGTDRVDAEIVAASSNHSEGLAAPAAHTTAANTATIAGSNRPARTRSGCWTRARRDGLLERSTRSARTPFGDGKTVTCPYAGRSRKAAMAADFDAVVEMGADFPCGRGSFAGFELDHAGNAVATRAFRSATPSDRSLLVRFRGSRRLRSGVVNRAPGQRATGYCLGWRCN